MGGAVSNTRRHLNRIRQFRMEMGLTQRELARMMGYESTSSLSHLEHGRKLPSFETMMKLQAALQRFIEDIYPRQFGRIRGLVGKRREALFRKRGGMSAGE